MNRRWWQRLSAPLVLGVPLGALPLSAQCPPEADSLSVWAHEALRFLSWPEADSLTREMTLRFPECPEGFVVRSYYLSATRQTLQARNLLDRALDLDSALEEARAMIALNPDYPDAYEVRAQIWEKRGEWGPRVEDLLRVLERESEPEARVTALVALGGARIELGQLTEARKALEDAARLDAAVGRIYFYRAKVNQMEGRLAEARADLRLAIVGATSDQHRQEAQQLLSKLGSG